MPLKLKDLKGVPTMVVKISRLYEDGMTEQMVYDAVRWCWRVSLKRASKVRDVYAVANGRIVGVFCFPEWKRVSSAIPSQIPHHDKAVQKNILDGRGFFTCEAEDVEKAFSRIPKNDILDAQLNGNGSRTAVLYFNC